MTNLEKVISSQLKKTIGESIGESIEKILTGYNSPFSKLVGDVFEQERDETTKIVKSVFKKVIGSDEFKEQIKIEFQRKVAKNLVGQMEGQVKVAVNALKQDPTFKSRMILAIESLVKSERDE